MDSDLREATTDDLDRICTINRRSIEGVAEEACDDRPR